MEYTDNLLVKLPLRNERLDRLSLNSDLIDFVENYTIYLGENELELFLSYVQKVNLIPITSIGCSYIESLLIGALKHTFVYHRLLNALLGRDLINTLGVPYLIEADMDINVALLLLSQKLHKHCHQMLRSALENAVIHAFVTAKGIAYDDLPGFAIPPMKNHKVGMLNCLLKTGLITSTQARVMSTLYSELSGAVHSQYKYLSNKFEKTCERKVTKAAITYTRDVAICCITVMLQMDRRNLHG